MLASGSLAELFDSTTGETLRFHGTAVEEHCTKHYVLTSPVTISLFPTSIDLDPIFEKDRDLDRFRFSYRAGQSVVLKYFRRAGRDAPSPGNAIIGAVAAASSRRPPLLKSRPIVGPYASTSRSAHELGGMAPSGSSH